MKNLGGIFLLKTKKIKKLINMLEQKLPTESMEILKPIYIKIYDLYLKLPESKKIKFFSKLNKLRDILEEHLRSEKELESLLNDVNMGTTAEQKKNLSSLLKVYGSLPINTQKKYEARVNQLKNRLEMGHPTPPKSAFNTPNSLSIPKPPQQPL